MLVNPYSASSRELLAPIPGTRIIEDTLGLVGVTLRDPANMIRVWTIQQLYVPVRGRALGGIRAKVVDQKEFVSFCNQRDLEVLLDVASPGAYCPWLDQDYVEPGEPGWVGLCVDEQDMLDDLYDRELEARAMEPEGVALLSGLNFERRVHNGTDNDYIETMMLLWDYDPQTGMGPDTRIETIDQRWSSVERTPSSERAKLWLRL